MENHKNIKNWIIIAAICGGVLVLTVASIVTGAVQQKKEKESNAANVSVDKINLRENNTPTQNSSVQTEVEIQFEDCAVPVGTRLQMTALVIPENTEQALVWSSADSSILEVDKDGILTVKGVGTAAVTATVGTVSDSVVIEGIENAVSGSKNQFPVYTGSALAQGGAPDENVSGNGSGSGGSTGEDNNQGENGSSGGNVPGVSSGNDVTGNDKDTSNGGEDASHEDGDSAGNNTATNSPDHETSGDGTGGNGASGNGGSSSTEVSNDLTEIGFTQRLSNVYVCEEGGTYYGEIITQPNVTIIYIKLRSADFDAKIQSVVRKLLPESYEQVWSNYISANTDRTFTAEGRRVRIVAAPNGGHSQIVIYN